jgi:hypothetical protein
LEAAPLKNQFTTWSPWDGFKELGRKRKSAGYRFPPCEFAVWRVLG